MVAFKKYPQTRCLNNSHLIRAHNFACQWFSEVSLHIGPKGFKWGGIQLETRLIQRVPETLPPAWHLDGDSWKQIRAEILFFSTESWGLSTWSLSRAVTLPENDSVLWGTKVKTVGPLCDQVQNWHSVTSTMDLRLRQSQAGLNSRRGETDPVPP